MANINALVKALGGEILPDSKTHKHRFKIISETSGAEYKVAYRPSMSQWECSCPGWTRKRPGKPRGCKHLNAMMPTLELIAAPAMQIG